MAIQVPFLSDGKAARAEHTASEVIRETQAAVNTALDTLAGSVHTLGDDATAAVGAVDRSLQRGVDALRKGSQALRHQAQHGTAHMQHTIREDPLRSVLVAAATGAALAAAITLLLRRRH